MHLPLLEPKLVVVQRAPLIHFPSLLFDETATRFAAWIHAVKLLPPPDVKYSGRYLIDDVVQLLEENAPYKPLPPWPRLKRLHIVEQHLEKTSFC